MAAPIQPLAVTGGANDVVLTDGEWIRQYVIADRGWTGAARPDLGSTIADLAWGTEGLHLRTAAGGLWRLEGSGQTLPVVGALPGAALGLDAVTDARATATGLLFGGNGLVTRYQPDARGFDQVWAGGSGAVRIVGVTGELPLWLSDGVLRSGGQQSVRGHNPRAGCMGGTRGAPCFSGRTPRARHPTRAWAACVCSGAPRRRPGGSRMPGCCRTVGCS